MNFWNLILYSASKAFKTISRKLGQQISGKATQAVALSPLVEERIRDFFDVALRESASLLLREQCGRGLPMMEKGIPEDFDRIRLAVIKLSGGTIEGLERSIREAHIDKRDVLMGAGFGCDVKAHLHWNPRKK